MRIRTPLMVLGFVSVLLSGCPKAINGPEPLVERLDPQLVCGEQFTTTITILGSGFSPIVADTLTGDPFVELPSIEIARTADLLGGAASGEPVTIPDDPGDPGSSLASWLSQSEMTFDVTPDLALDPGVYQLTLTNPNGNAHTFADAMTVVPPPSLSSVEPDFFCSEQLATTLTLSGEGFLTVGGALPTVNVGGVDFTADAADGCTSLAGPADAETCTTLTVTVSADTLEPGVYDLVVTNPPPANCSSTEPVRVEVVAPPEIMDVVPNPICTEQFAQQLTIAGSGFLVVMGTLPTVTIGGMDLVPDAAQGCTDLTVPVDVQSCTELLVTVPQSFLPTGDHDVVVTNPAPAGCTTSVPFVLTVVPPPDLVGVLPPTVCTGGGMFTLTGSDFLPGATVDVDGTPAGTVTYVSDMELEVTIGFGLTTGVHDVTVTNSDGCSDTLPGAITVVPGPIVFFVDPPIVYNGVTLQATVYASGLTGNPTSVEVVHAMTGTVTALSYTWDPADPNRILAILPSGLAAGEYDVVVNDPGGCPAILSAGVTVVDTLSIAIDSMDPPFGWTASTTAVEITATDPVPAGMVQFLATPRAYLNPATPGPGTVATDLRSVAFVDATLLTAVVPDGLPADTYDLIVVNPDATVGLLPDAFEVTSDAPPTIDTIQPGSLSNMSDADVIIFGADFRNPSVELTCQDPGGAATIYMATVNSFDNTSFPNTIDVTVPSGSLTDGTVCVVRVINDDGTYVDFSALAITNPAEDLAPWTAGPTLTTARRAPVALAGRSTEVARFLYAIGGDGGAAASAMTTVEAASVSVFGDVGSWRVLPYALPEARTLAGGVRLGRFLYLVGGSSGTVTVDTIHRAEILDPLDAPVVEDIAITLGMGTGLDGGVWYYRVSAVFGPADVRNPDGESLASDPLVAQLPTLPDRIHLTLFWNPVPGAVGYRIYRTPVADMISGDEELLVQVTGGATTQLTDTGGATLVPVEVPLALGDTGQWRELTTAPLQLPREGMGIALGAEPGQSNNPDLGTDFYIYAIGGRDGASLHDTYEYLPITVLSPVDHVVGTWQLDAANTLSAARWQLGAYTLTSFSSSFVPSGETWVFAGGGMGGFGTVGDVEAAPVQPGGALATWIATDGFTPNRAGYGYVGINNFLYAFGGLMATPSSESMSAKLCASSMTPGCALSPSEPPDLVNWNNLGIDLSVDRYLMGSTLESAFIFIVGGEGPGGPSNTVDFTIW